jgi:hypothetical protein
MSNGVRHLSVKFFLGRVRGGKRGDPSEWHFGVTAKCHSDERILRGRISALYASGRVRGGSSYLLEYWRPLAKSARGDNTHAVMSNEVRHLLRFMFSWVELEEGLSTSSIDCHLERSERSPLFLFYPVMSNGVRHLRSLFFLGSFEGTFPSPIG